jgi:hypothetical protein
VPIDIQRGDILLVHSRFSLAGWLIRKITKSYWNHVAWAVSRDTVIESLSSGVRLSPASKYRCDDPSRVKVLRIYPDHITAEHLDMALTLAATHLGDRYDYPKILRLLVLMAMGVRRTVELGDWPHRFICSELVAGPLDKVAKFRFVDDVPVENIVPKDIDRSRKLFPLLQDPA